MKFYFIEEMTNTVRPLNRPLVIPEVSARKPTTTEIIKTSLYSCKHSRKLKNVIKTEIEIVK